MTTLPVPDPSRPLQNHAEAPAAGLGLAVVRQRVWPARRTTRPGSARRATALQVAPATALNRPRSRRRVGGVLFQISAIGLGAGRLRHRPLEPVALEPRQRPSRLLASAAATRPSDDGTRSESSCRDCPSKAYRARAEQVAGDVVVERLLVRAHRVLEQPRLTPDEGLLQELLRLPPQGSLHHRRQPASQLALPVRWQHALPVAVLAEQLSKVG